MGLSIHYSGAFKQGESLASLIEEVRDVAELYNWKYHIFEETFIKEELGKEEYGGDIYGICFTPTDCETVSFTFLSNGRMSSVVNLQAFGGDKENGDYVYKVFTKTQYAGVEMHKLLIHLFRHLSKKYLVNFTLIDEGQYWETGDEQLLQETFARYTHLIEHFNNALEIFPKENGETFEGYFGRLMDKIQRRTQNRNE